MAIYDVSQFAQWLDINNNLQFVAHYKDWELTSVFQPIFDKLNTVVGTEALVRIDNLDGQRVSPETFFYTDFSSEEDKINVERLSQVIHLRNFSLSKYRELKLFLNVNPSIHTRYSNTEMSREHLARGLRSLHLRSDQLVMEVVECDANDERQLQIAMHNLSGHGVKIAVDDYGHQASNQRRVEMLRPAIMKLDRSLMLEYMDGREYRLLDGIRLARRVGAQTVIEGIETEQQYLAMHALDIDMFQGYYLAMPEAAPTKIFVEAS